MAPGSFNGAQQQPQQQQDGLDSGGRGPGSSRAIVHRTARPPRDVKSLSTLQGCPQCARSVIKGIGKAPLSRTATDSGAGEARLTGIRQESRRTHKSVHTCR